MDRRVAIQAQCDEIRFVIVPDFNQARRIPAAKIRELAEGGYIERAEPVVFLGE